MNEDMLARIKTGTGFIAALDQSGGSTPKALRLYGIEESAYSDDAEMFDLIHADAHPHHHQPGVQRGAHPGGHPVRADHGPADRGDGLGGVPLDAEAGRPLPQGGQGPRDRGRRRPVDEADRRPRRAARAGQGARRLRHQDALGADGRGRDRCRCRGRAAVRRRAARSWLPAWCRSSSPRSTSTVPEKAATEKLLKDALLAQLDRLAEGQDVMLKLTLPEEDGYHRELLEHPRVLRVAALSGGYTRAEADARLCEEPGRHRQLLPSTDRGADRPDERRGVRRGPRRLDRGHLRGLVDLTIRCGPAMRRHRGHRWELGRHSTHVGVITSCHGPMMCEVPDV